MSVPNKTPRIFGIVDLKLSKLLTDVAGSAPTYDAPIDLPGVQSLKVSDNSSEIDGKGDEQICEVEYIDEKSEVSFECLYTPLEAMTIINGGEVVEGTDDVTAYGAGPNENGEYFKLEALTKDTKQKITLYKVRGKMIPAGASNAAFTNAAFKGTCIHTAGNVNGKPRRWSLTQSSVAMSLAGTKQVETAIVEGAVTTAGNASVIVTAAGMTGSPKTLTVAVALNDSAAVVAQKIREAMNADTAITSKFTVGGFGTAVALTALTAAANDSTLNIAIDNGTCAGLTAATKSVDTVAGQAVS